MRKTQVWDERLWTGHSAGAKARVCVHIRSRNLASNRLDVLNGLLTNYPEYQKIPQFLGTPTAHKAGSSTAPDDSSSRTPLPSFQAPHHPSHGDICPQEPHHDLPAGCKPDWVSEIPALAAVAETAPPQALRPFPSSMWEKSYQAQTR